jgi:uncharacterized protein (DUF433 family)
MATVVDIGTLITRTPGVCGGRPRIEGTRISVRHIVNWYKLGLSPEEILSHIEHLSPAQVYAALTYYHANREEIDTDMANEEAEEERIEREHYLSKKGP